MATTALLVVTCALLAFDYRYCRRRFHWMALPAAGLIVSTLYLRFHYAVDLLAGGIAFLIVCGLFHQWRSDNAATG